MKTFERVMRAMTHLNMGAAPAPGAWILCADPWPVGSVSSVVLGRAMAMPQGQTL